MYHSAPRIRLLVCTVATLCCLLYLSFLAAHGLSYDATAVGGAGARPSAVKRVRPKPLPTDPKYFHEPGLGEIYGHYDQRFYPGQPVPDKERGGYQRRMIRAYLHAFRSFNTETWLAHGTLLGWWWNGKCLPWDGDIDVQVWVDALDNLADNYNMTIYPYVETETDAEGASVEVESKYLLDINPSYSLRERGNWMNLIDARWIDISNGLFIDITALSQTRQGTWRCKNYHEYARDDLLPLHETTFEGVEALVPNEFEKILAVEYQPQAMTLTKFESYSWDAEKKEWVQ